ncbi:BglG family transcription antiterminator [Carnobacterium maltaromaticum]|uniref:BglG family transcription antiterminator n=1 Tax=Carnobacterium maltaromaticum TaxID=2751 RepID=UPI0039AF31D6
MTDERSRKLMKILVERQRHELAELENQTGLTRRQLEYTLEKINAILLETYQKDIVLENNRITISVEMKEMLVTILMDNSYADEYIMNGAERGNYLFLLLFYFVDGYFSINHFMTEFGVGKTTILADLKTLNTLLEKEELAIAYSRKEGYQLVGNEFDIRYHLMKMIIRDSTEHDTTFIYDYFIEKNQLPSVNQTKEAITPYLIEYQLTFVENRLKEFIYTLIFLERRLGLNVTEGAGKFHLPAIGAMKEYQFSKRILALTDHHDDFSALYLGAWILGLSVGIPDSTTKDYEIIMELVKRIILRFEALSGIRFNHQEMVINQLYSHLRPAYYRLYFKLPIVNPLHSKIKKEYSELFNIVSEALKPISSLFENAIPEEEIAFLTMHFASLSASLTEAKQPQKVALILCPNGIGSSSIVYTELKTLFPELSFIGPMETNAIDYLTDSYDLIFSTVPNIRLFYTKKPVYVVSPIMNTAEKYRLISDVYSQLGNLGFQLPSVKSILELVEKHATILNVGALEKELYASMISKNENIQSERIEPALYEITNPELIQLGVTVRNWEEAIRVAGAPLLTQGKITREYIDTIITNTKMEGPYMVIAKQIALPHARPVDGVEKLGISITSLSYPIEFGSKENDPVKYIFFLAATANNYHLNAMAELVKLLDDPAFFNLLDTSQDPHEVYHYLRLAKHI